MASARRGYKDWGDEYGEFPRYVSVAEKETRAAKKLAALRKRGRIVSPVRVQGLAIATTFWGKAWCQNLERYSDYASRMPRGRSYVRSGAVLDLQISRGKVAALVQGTSLYEVEITVGPVEPARWRAIVKACAGKVGSVMELLQGKVQSAVMEVISSQGTGLFPLSQQIRMQCSCADWAIMCKHAAAALYGVGARLDREPELLFRLRGVNPEDLVSSAVSGAFAGREPVTKEKRFGGDLARVFGIEMSQPREMIRRADLSAMGVSPSTVQYWIKTGVLLRTGVRGSYGLTERAEERLRKLQGQAHRG